MHSWLKTCDLLYVLFISDFYQKQSIKRRLFGEMEDKIDTFVLVVGGAYANYIDFAPRKKKRNLLKQVIRSIYKVYMCLQ